MQKENKEVLVKIVKSVGIIGYYFGSFKNNNSIWLKNETHGILRRFIDIVELTKQECIDRRIKEKDLRIK